MVGEGEEGVTLGSLWGKFDHLAIGTDDATGRPVVMFMSGAEMVHEWFPPSLAKMQELLGILFDSKFAPS